jgi:hypothetical protein
LAKRDDAKSLGEFARSVGYTLIGGMQESPSEPSSMSQSINPLETARGYCAPCARQFSIFLHNRVGQLFELLEIFENHPEVHICAISVHEATDFGVVRLIPNNSGLCRELLQRNRHKYNETDLLIVELTPDHTLTSLCLYLIGAELNIHFAYPLMFRPNGTPSIAISVDDHVLAGQILRTKEFRLLGEADLPGPNSSNL